MVETLRTEVYPVSNAGHSSGAFLTLTDLTSDRTLLGRLPPDLAQRYHALPVAEDDGRITVAMADPTDRAAREAIIAALAPAVGDVDSPSSVCIVQGDRAAIDAILAQLRPGTRAADSGYLLHAQTAGAGPGQNPSLEYGEALAKLLRLRLVSAGAMPEGVHPAVPVLVVVPWTDVPSIPHLLATVAAGDPDALLVARQPHWPLRRLLAVIRGDDVDAATIDWVVRLAEPSRAAVTVLAVVPASAALRAEEGMPALLTARTALGRRLRQAAQRLAAMQAEGRLHLCQGAAHEEIERELREAEYDLLIVGTRAETRAAYWRPGQLIEALLQNSTCPMLIVKGATLQSRL
jgi:nucleotide-binding universal stress UspA family protein